MKMIKIIQNTFIAGKLISASENPIELEDSEARVLVDNSKAEYYKAKLSATPAQAEAAGKEDVAETKKAVPGRKEKKS